MKAKDLYEMVAGGRPGDDRLGSRPLFFSRTAEPFSRKPVHKRATYRDSLVSSLDFSRAAGDMGLETGLSSSSSPGGTWQVEANGDGVDSMVCHVDGASRNIVAVVWRDFSLTRRPRRHASHKHTVSSHSYVFS